MTRSMCLRVPGIAGEGAELARHLGRGGIGDAGHDGGERAAQARGPPRNHRAGQRTSGGRRYWRSRGRACGSGRRARAISREGNCAISTEISSTSVQSRQACSKAATSKRFGLAIVELQEIQRGEIAGRIVEEHVFRAGIGGADRPRRRAGVPIVDGGVELDAGIGRGPGRMGDLLPELARLQRLRHLAGRCAPSRAQSPSASTASRKASVTRTELLEFWPETVR